MTRRILLPLERGDDDTGAVALARSLARRRNVELLLLRVEEWPLVGSFGFGWAPAWRAGGLQPLKSSLEEEERVPATILSPDALPSSSVLTQARHRAASLIVVPYRHDRALLRVLHTHAAERILRESPIPVLAVPAGVDRPPRITRILYAYESGAGAVPGLRHAIDFAQLFDAAVVLQRIRTAPGPEEGFLPSLLFRGKEDRAHDEQDERSLEGRLLWILRRREVSAEVLPPADDPVRDVLRSVDRNGIDLVHLAASRDTERMRLSLARHVLEDARVPVLVTREESAFPPMVGTGSRVRVGI
jgi:nucleotide-binding universal stress UspA family protein